MNKSVVSLGTEHEQALIEKYIDRDLPGTVDHEVGTRFSQDGRRIVDELAGVGFDA
ncbi:MAG: hypothetical protein JWR80_8622 [Bradyrhizobium sp.]|nr:hypothetical protein [Bradyrhizobium sp.]